MSEEPSSPLPTVLFIDDDEDVLASAALLFPRRGLRMVAARSPTEAWSVLGREAVDVILLDLNFSPRATSGAEGLALLPEILRRDPTAAVIVVTGHSGVNVAVAAMRAGAADFVMKPWSNDRLIVTLEDALRRRRQTLDRTGAPPPCADETVIIGESPQIAGVKGLVARAARAPASVLITGESGVGKSHAARAIHRSAGDPARPLVVLDLAAAAGDDMRFLDTELRPAFARAAGGDLILDGLDTLSPLLQSRLLSLAETADGEVRLIATATTTMGVRPDLLSRLGVLEIAIAPLRERSGDILILSDHYLRLFAQRYGRPAPALSPAAAKVLTTNAWPANVRGLRQALERAVILADGESLDVADLRLAGSAELAAAAAPPTLAKSEKALLEAALSRYGFNVSKAAEELGLSRASLYRRMAKHGL